MNISINLPDDVVHRIQSKWQDLSRCTLEALAMEAYRSGVITENELSHSSSPVPLRSWLAQPPKWLTIQRVTIDPAPDLGRLHAGEREAIVLAQRDVDPEGDGHASLKMG